MTEKRAYEILQNHGHDPKSVVYIPEGSNHFVFRVVLGDGRLAIAKFKKTIISAGSTEKRDTLFNGLLTLERETALYSIVRNRAGLPAPEILDTVKTDEYIFLLVEHLPGKIWAEYMASTNYSRKAFLLSLKFLGEDIAKAQRVTFPSFGDIMTENTILPEGFDNFADRFKAVLAMRLARAERRKVFTPKESKHISKWFFSEFAELRTELFSSTVSPVLVLTDMHGTNLLVDEEGRPTGYFDLESCQAAHPALEFYGLKFFLFNYFDQDTFIMAEKAFFDGFYSAGGVYDRTNMNNIRLENLLTACRVLELSESYFEVYDGIRDDWSARFKRLMTLVIEEGWVDYNEIGDIYRGKQKQPKNPQFN
ncbi:MAG: aminoglycoside phosphotransferase family protein [Bacteroidetes bacterium]|nr:aminoglycoside phosphotransferase family protein [Bacteroidota bacterium]